MSSQKNKKNYSDEFIKELNQWVLNIMSGDLSSRIKSSDQKNLKSLCSNLNIVSEMFENQLNKNNKQLEQFAKYKEIGLKLGIQYVESGPLVRSSYKAEKHLK